MFAGTAAIVLLACIASSKGNKVWDGLTTKWAQNPKDGFYTMPQTLKDAVEQGWTKIRGMEASDNQKSLGYRGDPRIMLLFSKCSGKVVGIQIGVPVADIEKANVPINYDENPAMTRQTLNGAEYFTSSALFHQDEKRNSRQLWLKVNGKFVEFPTNAKLVSTDTPYFLKRCVTWMGSHFYQISSTTDCGNIFPWVLLRVKDDIIGIIFQIIGSSSAGPNKNWFETLPANQLRFTLPDSPPCLLQYFQNYGYTSFHTWFKKDPLTINCRNECEAEYSTYQEYNSSDYNTNNTEPYAGPPDVCPI